MEIRVSHLSTTAFQKLDFCIESGKITALSLKESHDLFCILHLEEKKAGSIYLDGIKKERKNQAYYQKKIALVPEQFLLLPYLSTVEEYLLYFLRELKVPCQNSFKKIQDALRIVGLPLSSLSKAITTLSETEQKLLQIAVSLLANPEVFLLEDPFAKLDLHYQKKLIGVFRKLKEKYQKTIVFSTMDVDKIYQYADNVIFLRKGRIVCSGSVEEVFKQATLLKRNQIELPTSLAFIHCVKKKKQITLSHHQDVRDLIKDIYRNV